jgi:hypothetical protein
LETCDPGTGTCQSGVPTVCDDLNTCTDDSCGPLTGCAFVDNLLPCSDGDLCTVGDVCGGGVCNAAPVLCDDGDLCNGTEACDPGSGACAAGAPLVCNDGNACTDDTCDPLLGCVFTNNTAPCDDGDSCTAGEVCGGGTCAGGTPVVCDDGDVCNGSESCDPGTGACTSTGPLVCDDGNACTDDTCDTLSGCVFTNNTAPCDDANLCTTGDVCGGGTCGGSPVVCDDGDLCNGTESCDPGTGTCTTTGPLNCNDGNGCTDDSCNPLFGCVNANNTASCDDGDTCTFPDTCSAGGCVGGTDLLCVAQALEDLVQGADPNDLGGTRRARGFLRLAVRARLRIERALIGNPLSLASDLTRARKMLARMVRKIDRAINRNRMDATLASQMRSLAQQAIAEIDTLVITL